MPLGRLGKYERVDVLGHGVSGIVYLAWDTLLKRQVALKEIDLQAGDVSRFLDEARVMDRLRHPNIVHINGVDVIEGHVVIDMEYVKGPNLQQLLRAEGRLPLGRALDIAIQTLDALDYAHSLHTVHRDIKPANILIDRDGQVKLVDFGLAEILATNSYAGGAGTYAYMAPEDFAEEHRSDHQSDIWAVGVTVYEMLTARRPFVVEKTKDPFAWRRTLLNEPPAPLTPVLVAAQGVGESASEQAPPAGLEAVLDKALARGKHDRYLTAGLFRDDLRAIREGHPPSIVAAGGLPAGAERGVPPSPPRAVSGTMVPAGLATIPAAPPVPPPVVGRPPAAGNGLGAGEEGRPRLPSLFGRRRSVPMRVTVEPEAVHFGEVRQGDDRTAQVRVRFEGNAGDIGGSVASAPGWLEIDPPVVSRRRQSLRLTAVSERVWQPGEYQDAVRLATSAGEVSIPVGIRVLSPRRSFAEVALWFVPMLVAVLLPAFTIAWGTGLSPNEARHLVGAAALGSGLLAAMGLLVASAADLGLAERAVCGVLMAVMAGVLGVTAGVSARSHTPEVVSTLPATGVPFGILLFIQAGTRRHWKFWVGAIAVLAVIASAVFASVLSGGG